MVEGSNLEEPSSRNGGYNEVQQNTETTLQVTMNLTLPTHGSDVSILDQEMSQPLLFQ